MSTKETLILENELLRKKLALAEAWMRREVAHQKKSLGEESVKKTGRKKLDNILERESVDIVTRKLQEYFGKTLENAPKYTLEHLIDAEIYWQTLQKFPTLDALPVVSSYQKILDAFFERILEGFRNGHLHGNNNHYPRYRGESKTLQKPGLPRRFSQEQKNSSQGQEQGGIDRDIENVITKKYTLSLGRWFQFFEKIRSGSEFGGQYEDLFLSYLSEHHESLLETCITDPFFSGFSELISLEVFGRKRHDAKISYRDAQRVREIFLGFNNNRSDGVLFNLLNNYFYK